MHLRGDRSDPPSGAIDSQQHLKILKTAGLVRGEVEGPRTCYCLDREVLEQFKKMTAAI